MSSYLVLNTLGGVPDDGPGGLPAGVGHEAAVPRLDAGQRVAHAQVGGERGRRAGHAPQHVVHVVGRQALLRPNLQSAATVDVISAVAWNTTRIILSKYNLYKYLSQQGI